MNHLQSIGKHTACVHTGTYRDSRVPGINTPVYTSTAFEYLDNEESIYPRYFNTTNQEVIVKKIAALEHAENGLVMSSGMAAISTVLLGLLKSGDHVVFQKGLYGGTFHFVVAELQKLGISYSITKGIEEDDFLAALRPNTAMIYIETPSNPLLSITDIEMVANIAKEHGLVSVIDNTFASPVNQNPVDLGIDIVVHSATKYLGGHSDICAGIILSTSKRIAEIRKMALNLGGSLNAQTCALLERSIKTLALRVNQQNSNAGEVASYLRKHEQVSRVYYPGLKTHQNHNVAVRQMSGFGGMLSFELRNLDPVKFQRKLKLIKPAVSLGGIETTICSPTMTSHRHLTDSQRKEEGINEKLLRLSVGIEDIPDILQDLDQALSLDI
ncbi:MAG TPA: PLP-dependent aspartate aminotransferase family protein [Bacteroidales bacterium]|nr:PLP-dependent aspartate aminotransferase family protein [Bacteroidales bacterium]